MNIISQWRQSILALTFILTLALSGCAGKNPDVLMRDATAAAAAGKWNRALELSEEALAQNSTHLTALVLKGISQHALGQSKDAVKTLAKAAQQAPDNFSAQYFHGWILCENQQYGEALTPLKRAYAVRKNHPDLLVLLARACLKQNLKEGINYLQALRRHRHYLDAPDVYNGLGILWFGQQDYESARRYFLQAYQRDPKSPVVLQNLAVLHDQYLNRPEQAMLFYQKCLAASLGAGDRTRADRIRNRILELARERRRTAS